MGLMSFLSLNHQRLKETQSTDSSQWHGFILFSLTNADRRRTTPYAGSVDATIKWPGGIVVSTLDLRL